jgi:L,D-peptidoglycan transpeptidase YkuD (ErfK/YbiS/YcfS/YnhG family)
MIFVMFFTMSDIGISKNVQSLYNPTTTIKAHIKSIIKDHSQIIFVAVDSDSTTLSMYEKNNNGCWKLILSTEAHVGKNGIGKTKEGDYKTPTGIYTLTKAFGVNDNPGTAIPYTKLDEHCYWVSDSNSKYYNQFVRDDEVNPDWEDAEHLCTAKHSYAYAVALDYNKECKPDLGSAIFLHCAMEEHTEGCITVSEAMMVQILKLIKPGCLISIDVAPNITQQIKQINK